MVALSSSFKPSQIIVHHSDSADTGNVSWLQIKKWHTTPPPNGNGWSDIGYHAGVELVESSGLSSYEILYGRPWYKQGAHCLGQNDKSLGICFVGDFDIAPPPEAQLICGAELIKLWMMMFEIDKSKIFPHKFFNATNCPGKYFSMDKLLLYL